MFSLLDLYEEEASSRVLGLMDLMRSVNKQGMNSPKN